jgi:hypothetical protein
MTGVIVLLICLSPSIPESLAATRVSQVVSTSILAQHRPFPINTVIPARRV